jgi:hypothetical protein
MEASLQPGLKLRWRIESYAVCRHWHSELGIDGYRPSKFQIMIRIVIRRGVAQSLIMLEVDSARWDEAHVRQWLTVTNLRRTQL